MSWLYLSPHLDDAVFSCGGLAWEQASAGEAVQIWTIFAGDAPPLPLSDYALSLHRRWGTGLDAAALRREEDRLACQRLGATYRHFLYPDAIYRRDPRDGAPLYNSDEDLFRPLLAAEYELVEEVSSQLVESLPVDCQLVCPLALGNHADHQLVRQAAERAVSGRRDRRMWYYADLPYGLKMISLLDELLAGLQDSTFPVSEPGQGAWVEAAAAYGSQISTFWTGVEAMRADLRGYLRRMDGLRLWLPGS